MANDYRIECFASGTIFGWSKIIQGSKHYCQGFLDARKDYAPRYAYRIIDPKGKIIEETPAKSDVNIGMIAGFPTAEQYERAGNEALERARKIREKKQQEEERREERIRQQTQKYD